MSYKCIPDNLHKTSVAHLKKCVDQKKLTNQVKPTGKKGPVKQDYIDVLLKEKKVAKPKVTKAKPTVKPKPTKAKPAKPKPTAKPKITKPKTTKKTLKPSPKAAEVREKQKEVLAGLIAKQKLSTPKRITASPKMTGTPLLLNKNEALLDAIQRGNEVDVKKALAQHPTNIKKAYEEAISYNDLPIIKLLDKYRGVSSPQKTGAVYGLSKEPLYEACNEAYVLAVKHQAADEILNYFYSCGIDIPFQHKALYEAIKTDNPDTIQYVYTRIPDKAKINKALLEKAAKGRLKAKKFLAGI